MLFNSWEFLIFLPLTLLAYYSLRHRGQNILLLIASYVFYGWWDYRFLSLLAISTVIDFVVAKQLHAIDAKRTRARKRLLFVSLVSNLGILGFFKYFNFFSDSAISLLESLGMHASIPTIHVILPVGISFYTFQTLSYTIDVYRGRLKPVENMFDFGLYVAFFPQLVAGPIERATHLVPQILKKRKVTWQDFTSGCQLIFIGLIKKIAIADGVAMIVNEVFANPNAHGSFALLIGLYLFCIQIYCDFSGYSDIARGCSRLMGFELMINFQHPYFSTSITEFWRRWHISLSSWLKDYLYISLGGNRGGHFKTYRNLLLTMLLGGLWHGASWAFVVWGGLHGIYLAIHKAMLGDQKPETENRSRSLKQWPIDLFKIAFTLHLVALTWIFFRANDFGQAWSYLTGILKLQGGVDLTHLKSLTVALFALALIDIPQYRANDHGATLRWHWLPRSALYVILFLILCLVRSDGEVPFIYFQF